MAIFDHAECSVTVNDKVVTEYDCPSDQNDSPPGTTSTLPRTIEKYIESQADQNFAVRLDLHKDFRFHDDFNALRCDIFVDGKYKDNLLLIADKRLPDGTITRDSFGATHRTNGKWEVSKFRFSKLMEDETHDPTMRVYSKQVGDIKVRMTRARATLQPRPSIRNDKRISTLQLGEKSAKGRAVDSFTTLDSPVDTKALEMWNITRTDTSIWMTFILHYRSIDTLQQLGIVEMPLSKRPLEDRDPATLTPEEMLELVRRQKALLVQQEDTVKLVKKRLQQSEARQNVMTVNGMKRARSSQDDDGESDDEVQVVKKAKNDKEIEAIELD